MALNMGITAIAENVGLDFGSLIVLTIGLGGLIFFASGFKLGSIMLFVMSICSFMLCYSLELNYIPSLGLIIMALIAMVFTLFGDNNVLSTKGGIT